MRKYSSFHVFFFFIFAFSSGSRVVPRMIAVPLWSGEWFFYAGFLLVWLLIGWFVFLPVWVWLSRKAGFDP